MMVACGDWWWLMVNVGGWDKFCSVFTGNDCIFVCLYFSLFMEVTKSKKKNQQNTKIKYKTKKNIFYIEKH